LVWVELKTVSQAQSIISPPKIGSQDKPKMKKLTSFELHAHLLRSALIALSLMAVRVVPFALAQQTHREKPVKRYGSRTPSQSLPGNNLPGVDTPATASCRSIIDEGFDDIANLPGWVLINHSQPLGASDWFQGNDAVFPAFDGLPDAYIAANSNNGSGLATISNWLLTPEVNLRDGSTMTFYTRTLESSGRPDRLQVRMSTNGASTNVGVTAFDVGDFINFLLDINPTYAIGGYPETWTQFTINISGVPPRTTGRLAFRYFVENGGPEGINSNYIGIDRAVYCLTTVRVIPTPRPRPTPAPRR